MLLLLLLYMFLLDVVFSVINNMESVVTINPIGDAPTYVNGNLILEPSTLHHVSLFLLDLSSALWVCTVDH